VNPADLMDRARELRTIRSKPVFAAVAEAYKRAKNIVEQSGAPPAELRWRRNSERLREPAEIALRQALDRVGDDIRRRLDERNPGQALAAVASLGRELAQFFDNVRVMVPDAELQEARLALLAELRDRIAEIGDISYVAPRQA
jgi:glycyl-tRNA synthetase beta chain